MPDRIGLGGVLDEVGSTWSALGLSVGYVSVGDFWGQRIPWLLLTGPRAARAAIRVRVLLDGRDLASAQWFSRRATPMSSPLSPWRRTGCDSSRGARRAAGSPSAPVRLRIELSFDQPLPRVLCLTTGSNVARVQLGARTLRVTALGGAAGPWEVSDSAGMRRLARVLVSSAQGVPISALSRATWLSVLEAGAARHALTLVELRPPRARRSSDAAHTYGIARGNG